MSAGYVKIRLSDLRVGIKLKAPVYDGRADRNQLLLAAGAEITTGQLDLLKRRGVTQVLVHSKDLDQVMIPAENVPQRTTDRSALRSGSTSSPVKTTTAAKTSSLTTSLNPPTWKFSTKSFLNEIQKPKQLPHDPAVLGRIQQTYQTSLTSTKNVFEEFARDQKINSTLVTCVAEQQLEQALQDLDVYVSVGLQPVVEGYPSRQSVQTAMLAVSIGTIMGFSRDELLELSCGCLMHDAGMMLVPRHILEQNGSLNLSDRLEILKHPLHIANAMNGRSDIPHSVKATAYQLHERMNGSGYPRKRQHPQIHLFARVGAVADTYLAMVSPRNGRPGLSPYEAVEKMLYATSIGLFDPTVLRALLHVASLFPVGSSVTLNDGRVGRVSRANRERYDRPVIEISAADASPEETSSAGEFIDLSQQETLRIVSAGELVAV